MHRKRVTCELYDSYFRSMTITQAIPKLAEVTHPDPQISEEIAEAWKRVHISGWEFQGNIRPKNWTEGSKKRIPLFTKPLSSSRCGRCLGHRLLTSKSSSLINERSYFLSWLLLLHTSVRRENKYILWYINSVLFIWPESGT